jgi:hypothetical protein
MFLRVYEYGLVRNGGRWFRPRVYGEQQLDGVWGGWLIFFPLSGGPAIATARETTQPSLTALTDWATGLTPVYLEGALERALTLATDGSVLAQLARAEYEALADAEQMETLAEIERTAADVDEAAAEIARADAQRLRQQRLTAEASLATTEAAAARLDAEVHEQAARVARAEAVAAERRGRTAEAKTTRTPVKRSSKKK